MSLNITSTPALKKIALQKLNPKTQKFSRVQDLVVVEEAIEIIINAKQRLVLLASPTYLKELAVGALFSLGFINNSKDIIDLKISKAKPRTIMVKIKEPAAPINFKDLVISSSKGASGLLHEQVLRHGLKPIAKTFTLTPNQLQQIMIKLHAKQKIFPLTGGTHAAGIFNKQGKIIAFSEDIGRHNALDKVIGKCLLTKKSLQSCGVALSSRLSFEMIAKASRAGLEIIAAVSAPTSLAIDMARQWNITLCGFVRDDKANVYTHGERIISS